MPGKKNQFIGRKNELAQFRQLLSQRGLNTQSRVILIHGQDGIGKTALAQSCIELARKARWHTVAVNWAQKVPHSPTELLSILTDAVCKVINEQQIQFLDEVVSRIEAVQQTVKQYQQDHPEIWQRMLVSDDNEGDQMPVVTSSDFAEVNHDAQQRLISHMQQHNLFHKKLDDLVLRDPARKIGQALSDAMAKGVGRRGMVVWLDANESLPPDIEVFLRDGVICPAARKNAKLHFILSSSDNQYHERTVIDTLGFQHRIKGYGDRLYSPPPLVWEVGQLVDPEVREYLKTHELESDQPTVEIMKKNGRGVPLVMELLADKIRQHGYAQVQTMFDRLGGDEADIEALIDNVVKRFVESYPNPTELQMLFALALLLTPSDAALSAVCSLSEDETPGPTRQKLVDMYTFMNPDGAVHNVMRTHLRKYLRTHSREYTQFLGQNAAIYYQTLMKNVSLPQVEGRINDAHWQTGQTNLMNALCWTDENRTLKLLTGSILEGVLFKPAFAQNLLTLTSEFRYTESYWSTETCQKWDVLAQLVNGGLEDRLLAFEYMAENNFAKRLTYTHHAILNILMAKLHTVNGQAEKAIQLCDQVNADKLLDPSITQALASTYSEAGIALGFHAGKSVASEDALHAFRKASDLDSQSIATQYGLGSVLAAFNHLEEATVLFSKALNLNPQHVNTLYQRGMAQFKLGQYSAALVDFNQTLRLAPKNPQAVYQRGLTYYHLGDQHKALADFSKAINLNPDMEQAYTKRGVTYTVLGQFDKALADFEQALILDPQITEVYTSRGETYMKLDQPASALSDFAHALSLNPDSAEVHAQRGSTYASLDRYAEAIEDYDQALVLDAALTEVFVQRGDSYAALGANENALADFSQAITLDPTNAQAYAKRGTIHAQLGQLNDAMVDFEHALDLNPQLPSALVRRASVYTLMERYEEALNDFNAAMALDPTLTGIESQRGLAYLKMRQYNSALADLSIAAASNPEDATILYHQGLAYYHLELYDEALGNFRAALTINPQLSEAYVHRARTQFQLGQLEQALIDFGQAIAVDPKNAEAYYSQGSIQVDLNQYSDAISSFDQAIAFDPTLGDAYNKRGLCYANLNKIDYALEDFAQAIHLNPLDASVYNNRGNTYAKLNEKEKALLDYTQAITRNPQLAETYYNRGNILTDMRQFDNAIVDFSQAISLNPEINQAYYNRGNTYAQLGQLDKALADLNKVIDKNPNDTTALNNRGNIHADMGNSKLALADYEKALTINPDLGEVYTNRGLTFADIGQYDEALSDYAQALSIDGNDATAIYYSACAFGLLLDEGQACAWLEQAILMDESFRSMAESDPDFESIRNAPCFQALMGGG